MVRLSNHRMARLQRFATSSSTPEPANRASGFRIEPKGGVAPGVQCSVAMLKLLGSYAIAKLLGFGLFGAIVIYALLSLLT